MVLKNLVSLSSLINEYKIYINNGKVDFIDRLYKFPDIHWAYRDKNII